MLVQVTPHGQWSAPQRRMRWSFDDLAPGQTGIALIAFTPPQA